MTGFRNLMMGAAGAAGAGGYAVDNSMMLNDGDNEYLTQTFSQAPTNQKKFTLSGWYKRCDLSVGDHLFGAVGASATTGRVQVYWDAADKLVYEIYHGSGWNTVKTTQVFRDPHAWYNIMIVYDVDNSTSLDKMRVYLNGSRITTFDTHNPPSSSLDHLMFSNSQPTTIGNSGDNVYFDGYIAEVVGLDGQALTDMSTVGETDDNGVWRPIDPTSNTFGNNGFYLPFNSAAGTWGLGADASTVTTASPIQQNLETGNNETNNGDMSGTAAGIKYTAVKSGQIPSIQIRTSSTGMSGVTCQVKQDGGTGQSPSGSVLTNGEVTGVSQSGAGYATFTFPNGGPTVTAGTTYWFMIPSDTGTWGIARDNDNSEGSPGGRISSSDGSYNTGSFGHKIFHAGNHFMPVNLPTQTSDSPTNNHCVWSEVFPKRSGNWTLSEGNRKATYSSATDCGCPGSIGVSGAGTWYFEITASSSYTLAGIVSSAAVSSGDLASSTPGNGFSDLGGVAYGYYANNGYKLGGPSNTYASYGATFANTDVIGVAFDAANGTLTFYKNGSTQGQAFTSIDTSETWFPFVHTWTNEPGVLLNNGQTAFAHTPPTGYVGINTTNLLEASAPTIEDGSAHFQATTYSGNGTSNEINQSGNSTFQPDMVWLKERSGGNHGTIIDAVRGATKGLYPSLAFAEYTESNLSFDADGFSLTTTGAAAQVNASSQTYIGWQWLAGNATSTPSGGSVSSTVSVNQTAGFSIVSWTGTGANATVAHGLGAVPEWILVKNRDSTGNNWAVYHVGQGNTHNSFLDSTNAMSATDRWQDTTPTSTVFSVDGTTDVNKSTDDMIAYCWCGKPGFSKFGSYEGNVSADGIFIELGFKPAIFIAKNIDTTGAWLMFDSAREPSNLMDLPLEADDNKAEAASGGRELDFLSNGVKLRGNSSYLNSAHTFIYMAFAEHPFAGTTPATAR